MSDNPWLAATDPTAARTRAEEYAARFDRLAAEGADVHGEAALVHALLPPGGRVLDAGCGTGRVAARLAELGVRVVGADLDPDMVAVARERRPDLTWVCTDLAGIDRTVVGDVDLVVAAGNVMAVLTPGSERQVLTQLAGVLPPGGLLMAGFGLDDEHLPAVAPADALVRDLSAYDEACAAAGLELRQRFATWGGAPYDGGGYAVSIHARR